MRDVAHHWQKYRVYFARAETDRFISSETEKSDGCRWFTWKNLIIRNIVSRVISEICTT